MKATIGKKKLIFLIVLLALIGTLVYFCVAKKNTIYNTITNRLFADSNTHTARLKTLSFVGHEYANTIFDPYAQDDGLNEYYIDVFSDEDIDNLEVFYEKEDENAVCSVTFYGVGEYFIECDESISGEHYEYTLIADNSLNIDNMPKEKLGYVNNAVQEYVVPRSGTYKIEAWGAQGGTGKVKNSSTTYEGGRGAYTSGTITLQAGQKLYIYVGGKGADGNLNSQFVGGGYNGGGAGYTSSDMTYAGGAGGGSTDIRLKPAASAKFPYTDEESLASRIMVAAGGGGGSYNNNATHSTAGGGLYVDGISSTFCAAGQTITPELTRGLGGNGTVASISQGGGGGGYFGGVGLVRTTLNGNVSDGGAGCGGSSYISGHKGAIGVNASGNQNTDVALDVADSYNYSGFVFNRTSMIDGFGCTWNEDLTEICDGMPMQNGSTDTGNIGAGAVHITQIAKYEEANNKLLTLTASDGTFNRPFDPDVNDYILDLDLFTPEVNIQGTIAPGNLEITGNGTYSLKAGSTKIVSIFVTDTVTGAVNTYSITVRRPTLNDGEHTTYLQYVKNPNHEDITIYKDVYTYDLPISYGKVTVNLTAIPYDRDVNIEYIGNDFLENDTGVVKIKVTDLNATPSETIYTFNYSRETTVEQINDRYEYIYTGNYQTFSVPMTGDYRIETWGAQGGSMESGWTGKGGMGGYTAGTINLTKGEELYIYVGKQGTGYNSAYSTFAGGWNGGGSVYGGASGGGGATDVRLIKGLWNDSKSLNSRIIVAGGGGGSNDNQNGGAGGGLVASTGVNGSDVNGSGGSQYAGGKGNQRGSFGIGGGSGTISEDGGAGGGGYYGGGKASGYNIAGGGGSSYISGYKGAIAVMSATNSNLRKDSNGDTCTTVIAANDVTCSIHYSEKIFTDIVMENGSHVVPTHDGKDEMTGNAGNGFAVITPLSTKSENNFLKNITTNISRLNETFVPTKYDYTITAGMYNQFITLDGIPYDSTAKVVGDGKIRINVGENIIPITVIAENGDIKVYTVNVIREGLKGAHSNNLNYIELDNTDVIYVEPNQNTYNIKVEYNKYGIVVNAVPYDDDAIVKVEGNNVIAGNTGEITITVSHADNSIAQQIYKLSYTRQTPLYEPSNEYTYSCTGGATQFTAFLDGNYKLELWGAAGGGATHSINAASRGGNGGYTYGTIRLLQGDVLNLYVGCAGSYSSGLGTGGGWNGGGHGGAGGYGGGGATDVRFNGDTLAARIIVAGGGGGADNGGGSFHGGDDGSGGYGGGLVGGNAYINGGEVANTGGTQDSGYALGVGQSATINTDTGGAGGGYYGGKFTNNNNGGAGGGSSYINEELFTDYRTIPGNVAVPTFDGTDVMIGNSGNGYLKITPLNLLSENDYLETLTYDVGTLEPAFDPGITSYTLTTGTYDSTVTIDGTAFDQFARVSGGGTYNLELGSNIVTLTVTSQNGTVRTYTIDVVRPFITDGQHTAELQKIKVEGFADIICVQGVYEYNLIVPDSTYYLNVTPVPYDSTARLTISGFSYIPESKAATIVSRVTGERKSYKINIIKAGAQDMLGTEFEYTGEPQLFTAPIDGTYKLEAWGAQGGNRAYNRGGRGAYATGQLYMNAGESIWIYVGGSGDTGGKAGGWNGGGSRPIHNGGGGATDFRTTKDDLYTRFLVAGGGGSVGSSGHAGGYGGGEGAAQSVGGWGSGGVGATQQTPGTHRGTFGIGGNGINGYGGYAGAGGGGWYGGGGSNPDGSVDDDRGGGGGSSFALTKESYNITPANYHVTDKYYLKNTRLISGGGTIPSYDGTTTMVGNLGNGHAKVTYVNLSDNNFLESIIAKSGNEFLTLNEQFNPERLEYTINVTSDQTELNLMARPEDSLSTIEGEGEYEIPVGTTEYVLTVTSESGKERVYKVKITREANEDNKPLNIHISGLIPNYCSENDLYCKLDPENFDRDTTNYSITVPFKIKQLQFVVDKVSNAQVIRGNGLITLNKTAPDTYVAIEVQSEKCALENDTTTPGCMTTYFYTVSRDLTGDNDLSNIQIVVPKKELHFDPDIYEYTVSIPYEYTYIEDMRITTDNPAATYTVIGNENMELGYNLVQIAVTAPNGDVQIYTLNVYREKSTVTYLSHINFYNLDKEENKIIYDINPEYDQLKFDGYEVTIPNEITSAFVDTDVVAKGLATYRFSSSGVDIADNGYITNIPIGYSFIYVTVTAQDGSTDTYKFKLNRLKNSNTSATNIKMFVGQTEVDYDPNFDPDILDYTATVPTGTPEVRFEVEKGASTSTVSYPDGLNLVAGNNTKRIKITAEDGTSRVYTFTINRPHNQSNKLKNIIVRDANNNYTYTPDFDPDVNEYNLTVPNEVRVVEVIGELLDDSATIKGSDLAYNLAAGDNKVILTVISEAGVENEYVINIYRTPSDNANISSITIIETGQVIVCSDGLYDYTITVANDLAAASLLPILAHDGARYDITKTAIPLVTSQPNEFEIEVTAEDGVTKHTYHIHIIKDKSKNANLSFLAMEEGALDPSFNPDVIEYYASIPNEFDSGTFHFETEDSHAVVSITGNTNFVVGENIVTIDVIPETGIEDKKTYTVHVTRQNHTTLIDTLDSLTVEYATLDPIFDKHHGYYVATVENDVDKVYVGGVATDASSMVTGLGYYDLKVGKNVIVVRVYTSDKQNTRDYQVILTRKGSSEARLSNMVVNGSVLVPGFNPDVYEYEIETTDTYVTFEKIETMHPNATYQVWNNYFTDVDIRHTVTVEVTAEDGVTKKTYTIIVHRHKSGNNYLQDLQVVDYTLTPTFKKSIYTYYLTVPSNIGSVVVKAAPEHPLAQVYGTGSVMLYETSNAVDIVVEAENGEQRVYTIIINRVAKDDATLRRLVVNNGSLSPEFDPETTEYNVVVPYGESMVDLSYNTNDPNASSYNTDVSIGDSDKDIEIRVTAEDGVTTKTYILHVTKGEIVSSLLKELEVKDYLLNPSFDPNITSYDLILNYETTSIEFLRLSTLDPSATYTVSSTTGFTGDNTYYNVYIDVTASDGVETTRYTLRIYHQEYASNFLNYISYNLPQVDDSIYFPTPTFDKYTLTYYVDVPHEIDQIILDAGYSNDVVVEGLGLHDNLEVGTNYLTIDVKKDNIVRTYIIRVTRAPSDKNLLTGLKIKYEDKDYTPKLDKAFDPDQHEYNLTVDDGTPYVELTGNVPDKATVTGLERWNLALGTNLIQVIITSQSGDVNTYKFYITRNASTDNELIDLIPSAGYLAPLFNKDIYEFDVYLNSSENKLGFECRTVTGLATIIGADEQIVSDGDSDRTIVVRAEDGSEKTYLIHVHKSADNNAYLRELSVKDGVFETEFDPTVLTYKVTLPNHIKELTKDMVTAIPQDGDAEVLKSGKLSITTKNYTTYTIVVTAADKITKVTYQLDVIREIGSEHTLASLKPKTGYLQQTFKPVNTQYTYLMPTTKTTVSIEDFMYTLTDENSIVSYSDPIDLTVDGHPTIFNIRVSAEDGSGYTDYFITLKYDYNSDNTLSSLKVENGYMVQAFKTGLYTYDIYEYEDSTFDIVTATTTNPTAQIISGIGRVDFDSNDEYESYIVVKAQDGSLLTYTLHFIRTFKTDKTLQYLGIDGVISERDDDGVFNPTFDPDVVEYDVNVPFTYTKLNMIYQVRNDEQYVKYKINNTYVENNTYSLPKGKTVVLVEVYDGLHKLTTTYTVNVFRLESYDAYLTNLVISNPETGEVYKLTPTFASNNFEYEIEVASNVSEVKVKATTQYSGSIYSTDPTETNIVYKERSTTIVRFNGYNHLLEGDNLLKVTSTAPDGSVYQYLVHVVKQPIFNSWLKQITVSTGEFHELTPKFRKTNFSYTLTLPVEIDSVTINAIPDDSTTVVRGTGQYDIGLGMNIITLVSTAVDGSVSTYQLGIMQESERDVDLSSLIIDECNINPKYDKSVVHYTCDVDPSTTNIHVVATPDDPKAHVNITGDKNLITGENLLEVQVVSPDKALSKTYQVSVMRRINDNANLTNIQVYNSNPNGELTYYDLTPEFDINETNYKVTVPYDIDNVIISASKQVITARVSGTGVHFLNFGDNYIDVVVTAEDGTTTKTYKVNVYREFNLLLSNIITNVGTLTPTFDKNTKSYTLTLPNKTETVYVRGIPEDSDVTVGGNGTYTVGKEQPTTITLILTSPDGNTGVYTINAIQRKNDNPYASSIVVSEGALDPEFNKITAQYTLNVRPSVIGKSLNINVQPEENTTTYKINGNNNLKDGENKISIVMTAEDGTTSFTYLLNVVVQPQEYFANILSSLVVTPVGETQYAVSMNPNFDPNTNSYVVTVPYSIEKVNVAATPQNANATVTGTGVLDLPIGRSVHNITVTSVDGEDNTYSLNLYRLEDDASLASLSVKNHNINPMFSKNNLDYDVEIETSETFLDITAVPVDPGATVQITGNGGFVEGSNIILIKVTTVTGKEKTYTLTARAKADDNPYLSELSIKDFTIQPSFEPTAESTYLLTVDTNVNSILINAVPQSITTSVDGDGAKSLSYGNNTFVVTTTAESGRTFTYTIVVTRPADSNSKLASLEVTPGELTPAFKKSVLDYEVVLPAKTSAIRINAIAESENATVDGNGTYYLNDNETIIPITVTAADNSVTIYSVKVIVEDYSSSLLAKLRVKEGELIPNFISTGFDYNVIVPYEIDHLNIIYATEDDNATVHISGNENFEVGINTVTITVLASDNTTTSTYTLSVVRQPYANDYLGSLSVTSPDKLITYDLVPEFDPNNLYYEVTVPYAVSKVKINATKGDPSNIISSNNLGNKNLNVGDNVYPITVYSTSGYQRTYTVVVTRQTAEESSADNYLLTLEEDIDGADLVPAFDPDTTEYSIVVPSDTNSITFTGTSPTGTSVVGFGKSILKYGTSQRTITVTGTNGNTKSYYINITRSYTDKTKVNNIIPSVGTLNYVDTETEYDMEVPGDTEAISFQVITADPEATVSGNERTVLQSGLNIITITITGSDGEIKNIHIFVTKKSSVSAVTLDKERIIIGVGEQLSVDYQFTPADTDYTDVTWTSADSQTASVAANGLITGVKPGITTITITSAANSDATDTLEVEVINKKLINNTYTIVRKTDEPNAEKEYVYTQVHGISIADFVSTFDNKMELVHIYDSTGVEIDKTSTSGLGSGMEITLELDNTTLDRLLIIIKGDSNGDGLITAPDIATMNDVVLGNDDTWFSKVVTDVNCDDNTTAVDNGIVSNVVLGNSDNIKEQVS